MSLGILKYKSICVSLSFISQNNYEPNDMCFSYSQEITTSFTHPIIQIILTKTWLQTTFSCQSDHSTTYKLILTL